jgi:hypothetical protein
MDQRLTNDLDIGRKLSAIEPTAFIDEIKHRMSARWNELFPAARSCDLEAGKRRSGGATSQLLSI